MSTADRFPYSSAPIKRVKAVQFCVWDPDEIVSTTEWHACMRLRDSFVRDLPCIPVFSCHACDARMRCPSEALFSRQD